VDIALVQEPIFYQSRIKGIKSCYRTYAYGKEKSRAAIIIPNDALNAIMITQCSENDTVLLEIKMGQEIFHAASALMEYNDAIENSLRKIEKLLKFTRGVKFINAVDRNSMSTAWHDVTTNVRGTLLEEFILSNQLQIINEESGRTIFHITRGQSNIDITITDIKILTATDKLEISEKEIASNHNII